MQYFGLHLPFPTRMTIVRLPDEQLWIHSPTEPSEGLWERVRALGRVTHLVAPNTLHYWWIGDWHRRFPEARVFLAPDLLARARRNLPQGTLLKDVPPAEWGGAFEQTSVHGPILSEVDFFHRASRTLILTDLIENFEPERVRSRFYRWVVGWSGCAHPDGKAPIDMQLSFLFQRKALRRAVKRMLSWAPERVILAHGLCYPRDGVRELERAFRWVL